MKLRDQLILTFDLCVAASPMGEKRLSTIIFGSGNRFEAIRAGSDISTGTFERAMQWLSDNWPEGAVWPEGVDRPLTAKLFDETFDPAEGGKPDRASGHVARPAGGAGGSAAGAPSEAEHGEVTP